MMHKILTVAFFIFSFAIVSHAQYMELGVMTGGSNYKGDLQSRAIEPSEIHMAYGVFARYNLSRFFSVRLQGMYTNVSGTDLNHRANNPLRDRNLSFQSSLIEASLMAEVNVFGFDVRGKRGSSLFLFGGAGVFKFNPQAELLGVMYDLQPLGTEGQNQSSNPYKLISTSFPVGIGAKIALSSKFNLTFEYGLRFTLTDYLDDVSTFYPDLSVMSGIDPVAASLSYRSLEIDPSAPANPFGEARGDANSMDKYMIGGITLSFNLAKPADMEYEDDYKWE